MSKRISCVFVAMLLAACGGRRAPLRPTRDHAATLLVRTKPAARVSVSRTGVGAAPLDPTSEGTASTGGLFLVPALPRGDYRVAVSAPGHARSVHRVTLWRGIKVVESEPRPEAILSGQVFSGDTPILGAQVTAEQAGERFEALSGANGRFRVGGLADGPVALVVRAVGFADAGREAVAPVDRLEVFLQRLAVLRGTVRAAKGPAPPGTVVHVGGSGLWPPTTIGTNDEGAFLVDLVEGVYEIRAEAPGMVSATVEGLVVERGGVTRELVLVSAAPLAGTVRDEEGKPVSGALVRLGAANLGALGQRAFSDAKGEFRLGPLARGTYRVEVSAAGFLPEVVGPVDVSPPEPGRIEATLSRGATVSGEVVDTRGSALASARIQVRITGPDGLPRIHSQEVAESAARFLVAAGELGVTRGRIPFPSEAAAVGRGFQTDDRGAFRISGLPPGKATVSATHPEFSEGQSSVVELRVGEVVETRLVLRRGAQVAGRVFDEAKYPLSAARVGLRQASGTPGSALTDEHGDYVLTGSPGVARVVAERDGYLPASRRVSLKEDERLDGVDLTLDPARLRIEGRVSDEGGIPVKGASISIRPSRGPDRSATTDEKGWFRVENLGPGSTRIEARHPDFVPSHTAVLPEQEEELEIVLPFGGGVEGRVRDAHTNEPTKAFTARCGSASVDGVDGTFLMVPIPEGPCTLEITAEGYRPARMRIQVPSGRHPREVTLPSVLVEVDLE